MQRHLTLYVRWHFWQLVSSWLLCPRWCAATCSGALLSKASRCLTPICQYICQVHNIIQTRCRNFALYAVVHVKLFNIYHVGTLTITERPGLYITSCFQHFSTYWSQTHNYLWILLKNLLYITTGFHILVRNVATTCIFKVSEGWHEAIPVWINQSSRVTCDPNSYLVHFASTILAETHFCT